MHRSACLTLCTLLLAIVNVEGQVGRPCATKVTAAIEAGNNEIALDLLAGMIKARPDDPAPRRARMNLLLSMKRYREATECARRLLEVCPEGYEKASLRAFANLSNVFFENMPSSVIMLRLETLRGQGAPAHMAPLIQVLGARILRKVDPPNKIVGEFYGSDNRFFDRDKAIAHFNLYLGSITDKEERVSVYKSLLTLEKGDKLQFIAPAAGLWTPEKIRRLGQLIHRLPRSTPVKTTVELYKLQSHVERASTDTTEGSEYRRMAKAAEKLLAAYNELVPEAKRKTVRDLSAGGKAPVDPVVREAPIQRGLGSYGRRTKRIYGGRRGGRSRVKGRPRGAAAAIDRGLKWLKNHQDDDGRWDCDAFMRHDKSSPKCDGKGNPVHDIGVTGLALLAFLGDGSTMHSGPYKDTVERAAMWLRKQQGANGLYGTNASHDFIYDHAIATYAMCEAYGLSNHEPLRRSVQAGIDYLESHRNPNACWRYLPRDNDNDISITGWCIMAYKSAKDFKLRVNEQALKTCGKFLDALTDSASGQCGYTKKGERSARHPGDHGVRFPIEKGEAMTGVGLFCRFFLEQDPKRNLVMKKAANTLRAKPPIWDTRGSIDHYYWYYATYALYQMGGDYWKSWSKRLTPAVVEQQRKDGNFKGSWDPVGAWGEDGGRVYSTALLVLTLEAYYRYARLSKR